LNRLKGFQRKYLRRLAHGMKPVVFIGQKGYTDTVIQAIDNALMKHELIKVKFVDFKDKSKKNEIIASIEEKTGGEQVGMLGHISILYRENTDPEQRRIILPAAKP